MKILDTFYQEIDNLKRSELLSGILYKLDKSHAHFPFVYNEIVVLSFVESIEAEKIIKVRNYIERVYGQAGLPADKVELISSHTIEVSLVKVRSTSYESY